MRVNETSRIPLTCRSGEIANGEVQQVVLPLVRHRPAVRQKPHEGSVDLQPPHRSYELQDHSRLLGKHYHNCNQTQDSSRKLLDFELFLQF